MAKSFTIAQLKELLDIHENTIIKTFTNRIENLESKIASLQEEYKPLKDEVKALHEPKFKNRTYEKMKNDMMKEKQNLETDNKNKSKT